MDDMPKHPCQERYGSEQQKIKKSVHGQSFPRNVYGKNLPDYEKGVNPR